MPLGTLDRSAPPLFHQGPSALSKLILFGALALFLMVADARFHVLQPIRQAIGTVLYPVQWALLKPVRMVLDGGRYFDDLHQAQSAAAKASREMALLAERANQVEAMSKDNVRLRQLLELRQTTRTVSQAAEVLFDAADPYSRKIVIDQGRNHGVVPGSPVIDADGVLGQVTLVQPLTSEVTLVVDRDQSIPVQVARTGARSVLFGDASAHGGGMELRFMSADADLREGDLLATSGVDGVYPAGLPVARIDHIERRADSPFARIRCVPMADVTGVRYVLVLQPVGTQLPGAQAQAEQSAVPAGPGRSEVKGGGRPERPGGSAGGRDKPAEKGGEKGGEKAATPSPEAAAGPDKPKPAKAAPARTPPHQQQRREQGGAP